MEMQTEAIFTSIPEHNHLKFYDETQLRPKAVVDFLKLDQGEVARATSVPKTSVRYDKRIPQDLKERLMEIGIICELVAGYFDGDIQKTYLWFTVPNPILGMSPRDMIRYGRYRKLLRFVKSALAGNAA